MLDLGAIETAGKGDIIDAILPVVFNLTVAWWLLGGGWLMRRAYPEAPGISDHAVPMARREMPATAPSSSPELANMDTAEKKLEALVEIPNTSRST